jgi:hypothetical protein
MKNISKHVSYKEAVRSNTAQRKGIENIPNEKQLFNMGKLCENVFEPTREYFKQPIIINSMFRCVELNKAVGGSKTSQHCKGEAMDIRGTNGVSNAAIYYFIRDYLDFDQLIWEYGTDKEPAWVHVSYKSTLVNRKQTLRIK